MRSARGARSEIERLDHGAGIGAEIDATRAGASGADYIDFQATVDRSVRAATSTA
jgi:hypothetical protein